MLLAELLKDDVKDSLYAKTKDYYVGDVGKVAYKGYLIIETSSGEFIVEKEGHRICTKNSLADAKKDIDYLTQDSKSEEVGTSDSCKVGDVGGRQIIFKYKLDGEVKTIKMPVREILRYSNKNASEAATRYLSENFPGAKLIEVGTTDSCKVGDVAFGGSGVRCVRCGATSDMMHKLVHKI